MRSKKMFLKDHGHVKKSNQQPNSPASGKAKNQRGPWEPWEQTMTLLSSLAQEEWPS